MDYVWPGVDGPRLELLPQMLENHIETILLVRPTHLEELLDADLIYAFEIVDVGLKHQIGQKSPAGPLWPNRMK